MFFGCAATGESSFRFRLAASAVDPISSAENYASRGGGSRRPLPALREVGALSTRDLPTSPDQPVTGVVVAIARADSVAGNTRLNTANARITSPIPVSSNAIPTTMPNTASRSAM